jgi:hypothetical protein
MNAQEFQRELAQCLRASAASEWDRDRRRGLLRLADEYERMAAAGAARSAGSRE